MTNHTKVLAVVSTAVLLASYGIAFAEGPPGTRGPNMPGMYGRPASTTWAHGSTTPPHDQVIPIMPGFRGVPGVVTEVDADHFLMTSRGLGKDAASTTLTVNVTSSTKFYKIGIGHYMPLAGPHASSTPMPEPPVASTTASFADLTVGAKVEVLGKVATSTKTITALRVLIGNDNGRMGRGGEHQGSTTSQGGEHGKPGGFGGLLEKLKNLFGNHGPRGGATTTAGGPAAADGSGDFVSALMNALFGWMH